MEKAIREFWTKIIRTFLDVILIDVLRKRNASGYFFVKYVHDKFDVLISSGTVYAVIGRLEKQGMIQPVPQQEGNERLYTATKEGVNFLNRLLAERCEIKQFIMLLLGNGSGT